MGADDDGDIANAHAVAGERGIEVMVRWRVQLVDHRVTDPYTGVDHDWPVAVGPSVVLWAWCAAYLARDRLPRQRVVVRFEFPEQPPERRRHWLLFDDGDGELCTKPPRFDEDLIVSTDTVTLARWHLQHIEWTDALRSGRIRVSGPRALARSLPTWNLRSPPSENHGSSGSATG